MNNILFENGSRNVSYKYVLVRNNIETSVVNVSDCSISYDSESEIKRTAQFTLYPNGIDFLRDKIRVYMIINNDNYCLGTFIMTTPTIEQNANSKLADVDAYDNTIILQEDCFTEPKMYAAGTRYDAVISDIIRSAQLESIIPQIMDTLPADREFEVGTNKLIAVNTLLDEINYNPIIADEYGNIIVTKYIEPNISNVSLEYIAGENSVILSEITSEIDYYNIPNIFIARCDNPELDEIYYSKYVNDNPGSKLSTISRGRNIVSELYSPDYTTSQQMLDEYIRRRAYESSLIFDKIKITTANMPNHGYRNIIRIRNGNINGIYIEKSWEMNLSIGSLMTHNLVGVNSL